MTVRDSALPAATEKMQNTNRHEFARIFTNEKKQIQPLSLYLFVKIRVDWCRFVFLFFARKQTCHNLDWFE